MADIGVFKVSTVDPVQNAIGIPVNKEINISFNTDVDAKTLINGIFLIAVNSNTPVLGTISYDGNRTATFTPAILLSSDTQYSVIVRNSIKNILGMQCQAYEYSFTTRNTPALSIVTLSPSDMTLLRDTPPFQWKSAKNADGYEIEVSTTTDFAAYSWASTIKCPKEQSSERVVSIDCGNYLEDNILFFWRVRAFTVDTSVSPVKTNYGEWSSVLRFKISRAGSSVVTPEDEPYIDPAYQDFTPPPPVIIETFPEDGFSNVGTNLRTIYIRIKGIMDPLKMDPRKWSISGMHITEDLQLPNYDPSVSEALTKASHHGELQGSWSVVIDEELEETVVLFQPVSITVPT